METKISLITEVDVVDILDNLEYTEEEDFLLQVLEGLDSNNVNAAVRNYFGNKEEQGEGLPDFVNANKL